MSTSLVSANGIVADEESSVSVRVVVDLELTSMLCSVCNYAHHLPVDVHCFFLNIITCTMSIITDHSLPVHSAPSPTRCSSIKGHRLIRFASGTKLCQSAPQRKMASSMGSRTSFSDVTLPQNEVTSKYLNTLSCQGNH